MHGRETSHNVPRWVKGFGIVALFALLLAIGLHIAGGGSLLGQTFDHANGTAPSTATERGPHQP